MYEDTATSVQRLSETIAGRLPVPNDGVDSKDEIQIEFVNNEEPSTGPVQLARACAAWALTLKLHTGHDVTAFAVVQGHFECAYRPWASACPVQTSFSPQLSNEDIVKHIENQLSPNNSILLTHPWEDLQDGKLLYDTLVLANADLDHFPMERLHCKYPMALIIDSQDSIRVSFRTNHFSPTDAHNLIEVFKAAMYCVTREPDQLIDANDLLPATHRQLLADWTSHPPEMIVAARASSSTSAVPVKKAEAGATHLQNSTHQAVGKNGDSVSEHTVDGVQVNPCTAAQEYILLSRVGCEQLYESWFILQVKAVEGCEVKTQSLADGWQKVVDRHPLLRAKFCHSTSPERADLTDQIVLPKHKADVTIFNFHNVPIDPLTILEAHKPRLTHEKPPHAVAICQRDPGEAFLKLHISTLIFDGNRSIEVLVRDLGRILEGSLTETSSLCLPQFALHPASHRDGAQGMADHWKPRLQDLEPCTLPVSSHLPLDATEKLESVHRTLRSDIGIVAELCEVSVSAVLQLAWAATLQRNLNRDDVAFGLLVGHRDNIPGLRLYQEGHNLGGNDHASTSTSQQRAENDGERKNGDGQADETVGPFTTVLASRCNLSESVSVQKALESIHSSLMEDIAHLRDFSSHSLFLGLLQEATGLPQPPFSSAISISEALCAKDESEFSLQISRQYRPTEFDAVLHLGLEAGAISLCFDYWNSRISVAHAESLVSTFSQIVESVVTSAPSALVGEFNIVI